MTRRTRSLQRDGWRRWAYRLIAIAIVFSLVGPPVTYRAGAEALHPHSLFQFWSDATTGSFDHHHHDEHEHGHAMSDWETKPSRMPLANAPDPEAPTMESSFIPDVKFLALVEPAGWSPFSPRLSVLSGDLSDRLQGWTLPPIPPPPR